MRFEISVKLDQRQFKYSLAFEFPSNFSEAKILSESLYAEGEPVYIREGAEVSLGASSSTFFIDWHLVALPVVQMRATDNPIEVFRIWLAKAVLIAPVPSDIKDESDSTTFEPSKRVDNFAGWFGAVLSAYPASYNTITTFLENILPDFLDFQNKSVGELTKKIIVRFKKNDSIYSTGLNRLSDGEKIFFVTAVLLAANEHSGPVFCFWDEPDNYVATSEVGYMITELRKAFKKSDSGQIFMTSHNPQSIQKFSDESTLLLHRNSHLEPTRATWLKDIEVKGDLINAITRGEIFDVS